MSLIVNKGEDVTLESFHDVAWKGNPVEIGSEAIRKMQLARDELDSFIRETDTPIYGVTTGYAGRSNVVLSLKERENQAATPPHAPMVAFGRELPQRVVRGIIFSRLANFLDGHSAISPDIAIGVANMLDGRPLPTLSEQGQGGAGEILGLSPVFFDLATAASLLEKDTLSLINGAPCAAALVADATLAFSNRLQMAGELYALAAAAFCVHPDHFSNTLGVSWNNPHDAWALDTMRELLGGGDFGVPLKQQVPTSFRIIPRVLGQAHRVMIHAKEVSGFALGAVTDNPLVSKGRVINNGGFHDVQATAAMDEITACAANFCILSGRLAARITEQPLMMESIHGDNLTPFGFMPSVITGYEEEIRLLATHTLIPAGGASGYGANDVSSPVFHAWSKQERASALLEASFAALLIIIDECIRRTKTRLPGVLDEWRQLVSDVRSADEDRDGGGHERSDGNLGRLGRKLKIRLGNRVYNTA